MYVKYNRIYLKIESNIPENRIGILEKNNRIEKYLKIEKNISENRINIPENILKYT